MTDEEFDTLITDLRRAAATFFSNQLNAKLEQLIAVAKAKSSLCVESLSDAQLDALIDRLSE